MAKNPDGSRRQTYFQLSSQIAQLDNEQLSSLFDNSEALTSWGRNQTIEIGDIKIFVKRIPMTDIEQKNLFSTKNLYDLPTYYNYGIGSVGSGVFRELVTYIKTTNWVLSDEIDTFPLLYHYRVIPFTGKRAEIGQKEHREYVTYWGSNENISRYMLDRANANAEILLFLEYIPEMLHPWLLEHPEQVDRVLANLRTISDFLRQKDIIHFDTHFWNVLTDGECLYLTDFGLVLDRSFALREDEQTFFQANTHYAYARFLRDIIFHIHELYDALPALNQQQLKERYGIPAEGDHFYELLFALVNNIEEIHASGAIEVNETYLACIVRYRSISKLM